MADESKPPIFMQPVDSTNVAFIGYDPAARELRVRFHNGSLYAHYGIEAQVWHNFRTADSCGRFYNEHIKGTAFRRIEEKREKSVTIEDAAVILAAELEHDPYACGGVQIIDGPKKGLAIPLAALDASGHFTPLIKRGFLVWPVYTFYVRR